MTKKIFYSPATNGFYPPDIYGNVIQSGFIEISIDDYHRLLKEAGEKGKQISPDENGYPVITDIQGKPTLEILQDVKSGLRGMRAPLLDALSGIAGRAARAGNDALASEADALAEQLLGITDDPALNTANTHEEMRSAGMAAYKRIAESASTDLAVVFREITGA